MQLYPLSEFDFHPRLAQSRGVSLVLFSAPDCGSCRVWRQLLRDFASPLLHHGYLVDVQTATALANEYDVFHLPALFLFIDGKFHTPIQSQAGPAQLHEAIAAALERAAREEP